MRKQEKSFAFRGKYLLLTVVLLYGALFVINSNSAVLALQKSTNLLLKIVPIFTLVIFLTALLNYYLQPEKIAKHLGQGSGLKGWLWALASGVISHGPMYAWYSLLEDLRTHGMKDELVVVFFASRAIKVPLLPVMVDYFGLLFTFLLSFYMLFGAILQGVCLTLFQRKIVDKV